MPKVAEEEQAEAIDRVVEEAVQRAGLKDASQVQLVAVTVGPGLSLCLRVGVMKARSLSSTHRLPIAEVHHMEAHALVARCCGGGGVESCSPRFPFLCLLVSGGHNVLLVAHELGRYTQLGESEFPQQATEIQVGECHALDGLC